jgi:TrmH family RNA methyltransferase
MISKEQIKSIRLLRQKKYRDKWGLFIAEGPKVIRELVDSKYIAKDFFCVEEYVDKNIISNVHVVKQEELQSISALTTANQVLGVFQKPEIIYNEDSIQHELILALDDIRDPGNLGTIIRIADWFGINNIICSESTVDVYNPKVIQSTMGSIARVSTHSMELEVALKKFNTIYAAVLEGENIYSTDLSSSGVILIGNESNGISDKLMQYVSKKISIPNFGGNTKLAESLNAAVATAVICSEFRRR